MIEHIVCHIVTVFLLRGKIAAGAGGNHAVLEDQFQIPVAQLSQIDLRHMEHTACPLQKGRGKDLSHRNVHVGDAVLEIRLLRGISQRVQRHGNVRVVVAPAGNMHMGPLIQHIDDLLLHPLIQGVIQGVDLHRPGKDFLEIRPDGGQRKGDDRKAVGVSRHIGVGNLPGTGRMVDIQLILFLRIVLFLRLVHRLKGRLPEDLDNRRSPVDRRLLSVFLKGVPQNLQPALHKGLVKIVRPIILVVIVKLPVGRSGIASTFAVSPPREGGNRLPGDHDGKSHIGKLFYRFPHHPLKSDGELDLYGLFLRDVFAGHGKSDPISLRESPGHGRDFLLWKASQKIRHPKLILPDKGTVTVEIPVVRKVAVHHNRREEIVSGIHHGHDRLRREDLAVVMIKPVHRILHVPADIVKLLRCELPPAVRPFQFLGKTAVHLQEQLAPYGQKILASLKSRRYHGEHITVEKAEHAADFLSQCLYRMRGIQHSFFIGAGRKPSIESFVVSFSFLFRPLFQLTASLPLIDLLYLPNKTGNLREIQPKALRQTVLPGNLPNSLRRQIIPLLQFLRRFIKTNAAHLLSSSILFSYPGKFRLSPGGSYPRNMPSK